MIFNLVWHRKSFSQKLFQSKKKNKIVWQTTNCLADKLLNEKKSNILLRQQSFCYNGFNCPQPIQYTVLLFNSKLYVNPLNNISITFILPAINLQSSVFFVFSIINLLWHIFKCSHRVLKVLRDVFLLNVYKSM